MKVNQTISATIRGAILFPLYWILAIGPGYAQTRENRGGGALRILRVAVPVTDLRREPSKPSPTMEYDPMEESQLLYGDPVEALEIIEETDPWPRTFAQGTADRMIKMRSWARVSAVNQPEFNHNQRWEGYPGWVDLAHLTTDPGDWKPNLVVAAKLGKVRLTPAMDAPATLTFSIGTRLVGITEMVPRRRGAKPWWKVRLLDGSTGWIRADEVALLPEGKTPSDSWELRRKIVRTAHRFLGDPYYWGGRSTCNPLASGPPHTGVDCSGLVGLAYQANGISIPRDAQEQWMKAAEVSREQLLPADLVFLCDPMDPNRASHVMLYIGDDLVIEGPGTGSAVRQIGLTQRLKEAEGRRVVYGSYLP